MTDKDKIINDLKCTLNGLDCTSDLRLVLIRTIEYLQEESVSEDLERAAGNIADDIVPQYPDISWDTCYEKIVEGVKAGAKWQKEIDDKAMEDADKAYFESCEKIRKHTIEKAVEWLKNNIANYFGHDNVYDYTNDFRKAMKE